MSHVIDTVDVSALDAPPSAAREAMDRALGEAAEHMGFLVITGPEVEAIVAPGRIRDLLRIFEMPENEKRRLAQHRIVPENPNQYRGYFYSERPKGWRQAESFSIGGNWPPAPDADDIERFLMEPNLWPDEQYLPGWREHAQDYYAALEALGSRLMRAFARYLKLDEDYFATYFSHTPSTLTCLHAIAMDSATLRDLPDTHRTMINGVERRFIGTAHCDSGVMTLLWQPGYLQAQSPDGLWHDVPSLPGTMTVNFGDCMSFWTSGRIRATTHRVAAPPEERFSVPFFYEPAVNAMISPINRTPDGQPPIRYGDHVFEKIRQFRG